MAKTMKMLHFKVVIEQDEDGWYVGSVPELPGCYTQAKTLRELRQRIKEAILLVLETDEASRQAKFRSPHTLLRFFDVEDLGVRYA